MITKINWVVAHQTEGCEYWQFVQGFEYLETARIEMHARPTNPKYKGLNLVAIFRNRGIDLKDSNWKYAIDLRDKSQRPIGSGVGQLINAVNSDFTINKGAK